MTSALEPDAVDRYRAGEDPEPLLRALAAGLLGGGLVLLVDRLLPSGQLAVFDPLVGSAAALPQGLLWPALLSQALLGRPLATAAGAAALLILLSLASFVYVYGQLRRFLPGAPILQGLTYSGLLWLLACPALIPRARDWLASGFAGGASAGGATAAALWLLLEPALALAAYGLTVGWICPQRPTR